MARLYLVRHGEAAAGWGDDLDPGLSDLGRAQADAAAATLRDVGPLPVISSPLRRCRETAAPLEAAWSATATVVPDVGEIESPSPDLAARATWLRQVMGGSWEDLDSITRGWRDRVVAALVAIPDETVVFTHFIAMNVAVGNATGRDEVVCFSPRNCAITVVDNAGGQLQVVELGLEGESVVR
ncbi:MAG TPA: histidine phosphatase family protein [Acidimicrobiales bacterium]|nr:histidine phosphatase family protein [Acidimicrobiales bacterium]